MADLPKTILQQASERLTHQIQTHELEPLDDADKAVVRVTSDQDTLIKASGAVDLGKGFQAGGEVEKTRTSGWQWFVGGKWRLPRK